MFPFNICEQVLVACRRSCCICNKFCGSKIELHHIVQKADGGTDTFENCIPLCFDCHAEVKAYNEYVTTIDLVIESVYPLSNLYLAAFAPTIIKMTVSPCRTGMFCTGHSGVRDGMAFTNIPNFKGNLQVKILTRENDQIKITFNTN